MGADQAGRDVFVRVIYGARTSLLVALIATGFAVAIGTVLGILAGYFGGKIDTLISRTIDVILSMPILLFAIGIVAACGATAEGCLGG
jgi:peptide/nickel transport system permease protein